MRAVVLACLVAACGDNEPGVPAEATSGTRLVLKQFTYEDGTVQIDRTAVRDTARAEDCSAQRWSDGLLYCTPAAAEVVFVDGQCLTRAARVPSGSAVGYGAVGGIDSQIARLYRLGQPYAGGTSLMWRIEDGQCAGPFAVDGDGSFVELADEVPRGELARITRRISGGGRLQVVEETSDDGLVLPARYHDRQLALDCDGAARPLEATAACAPVDAIAASYFADQACAVPVAAVTTTTLPPAIASDVVGCTSYFAVGAEVPAASLRTLDSCQPTAAPADARYFAASGRLALADVARVIAPGARLRRIELDGLLDDRYVHDTALDTDCAPGMVDGELRCVPPLAKATLVDRYADAACQVFVEMALVTPDPCGRQASFMLGADGAWRKLDANPPPPRWMFANGGCVPASDPPGTVSASVSPPFPTTAFAAVH